MYTNTPLDNHWNGTAPFLIVDQTVERNFFQSHITPYISAIFLFFGLHSNYLKHFYELFEGNEEWSNGKLLVPL
jgi:hypothetical protein